MTTVPDNEFFSDAERIRGKVVLITGGSSGFGKSSALLFARHGARIIIADRDIKGAEQVVKEIEKLGSQAIAHKCDVTSWEEQLEVFQRVIKEYGAVDVVVANAGVIEKGSFVPAELGPDNIPIKPSMTTINVNLIGVLYTAHLAQHYLLLDYRPGALKSLVLMGSMCQYGFGSTGITADTEQYYIASFEGIPLGTLYTASKHAILGLQKALYGIYSKKIHFATVCPWFSDTNIMVTPLKIFLAGIPLSPVERVAGTVIKAATESNPDMNGSVYTIPDGGETFRLDRKDLSLNTGVYKLLGDRAESFLVGFSRIYYIFSTITDLLKIGGVKLFVVALLPLVILEWKTKMLSSIF